MKAREAAPVVSLPQHSVPATTVIEASQASMILFTLVLFSGYSWEAAAESSSLRDRTSHVTDLRVTLTDESPLSDKATPTQSFHICSGPLAASELQKSTPAVRGLSNVIRDISWVDTSDGRSTGALERVGDKPGCFSSTLTAPLPELRGRHPPPLGENAIPVSSGASFSCFAS
ncbi:hypothetical protein HPB51_027130 [Rhipicephalus microplus]|uniref:Uncharacterized protein n=1 Tax=Rhipicephalus microplus TaxID=6941 RepID=A0A9J6D0Z2_RHIMP|nr:hypothetical protein HPB51_027130 [Rhipicephalus microplus]